MTYKEYINELGKIRGSRLNDIIRAVNYKISKEEAGLKNAIEERFYDSLIEQAEAHVKKYGCWPVFELCEIDYDDPILDIYKNPV